METQTKYQTSDEVIALLNTWLRAGIFDKCPMMKDVKYFKKSSNEQDVAMNCDIIAVGAYRSESIVGLRVNNAREDRENPDILGFFDNYTIRTMTDKKSRFTEFVKDLIPNISRSVFDIHIKYDPINNVFIKVSVISGKLKKNFLLGLNPTLVYAHEKHNSDGSAFIAFNRQLLRYAYNESILKYEFWEFEFPEIQNYRIFRTLTYPPYFDRNYWIQTHLKNQWTMDQFGKFHQSFDFI